MIRKYKIYIIMGITVLLLFMVLPVDTKGDWEIPWDITLEGEGNDPAFRSSTVMEIFLKNGTAPKDITVFVNQQKINRSGITNKVHRSVFRKKGFIRFILFIKMDMKK